MSIAAKTGIDQPGQSRWSLGLNSLRRRSSTIKSYLHRVGLNVPMMAEHGLLHRSHNHLNEALVTGCHFPSNKIKTSKYTKLGFLPKNLYEQFRRVANWFFLGVTILQFFPQFYTIEPIVAAIPFIIVLAGTALKDGFEDYKRHGADNNTNRQKAYILSNWTNVNRSFTVTVEHWYDKPNEMLTKVIDFIFFLIKALCIAIYNLYKLCRKQSTSESEKKSTNQVHTSTGNLSVSRRSLERGKSSANYIMYDGTTSALSYLDNPPDSGPKWGTTTWEDVVVGDLVLLRNNESIPADIVLLSSSEPECTCFVETKNLDGETNLKIRRGVAETSWLRSPADLAELMLTVDCEKPHTNMYLFTGVVNLPDQPCIRANNHKHTDSSQNRDSALSDKSGSFEAESFKLPEINPLSPLAHIVSPILAESAAHGALSPPASEPTATSSPSHVSENAGIPQSKSLNHLSTHNEAIKWPRASVSSSVDYSLRRATTHSADFSETDSSKLPLNINNLLLRGCVVRNTEWAIGLVVYTGRDTKVILNSGATPSKRSKLDVQANPQILLNLLVLLILCIVCAIGGPIWSGDHNNPLSPYIWDTSTQSSYTGVIAFFNAVISFQSIVPISFYISIELVKLVQALFIHFDIDMYYEPIDTRCQPRTYNLSDDLGRIEYVFSDKTGTLTRNVMEFKKCSIGGVCYLSDSDPNAMVTRHAKESSFDVFGTVPPVGAHSRGYSFAFSANNRSFSNDGFQNMPLFQAQLLAPNQETSGSPSMDHGLKVGRTSMRDLADTPVSPGAGSVKQQTEFNYLEDSDNKYLKNLEDIPFYSSNLILHAKGSDEPAQFIGEFFRILAVCHSVLVSKEDPEFDPFLLKYKAQSPDEAALVDAARAVGFVFTARDLHHVTLDVFGKEEKYQLLNMIEFNSTRKRMSVIVRKPNNQIVLYCKGADTVIFERLRPGQQVLTDVSNKHLEDFAREGLRTLCLAYTVLDESEYQQWNASFQEASMSLVDRETKMDACAEDIEQNLIFVGATAIEDKLQDGVPEAIQILGHAGMKLWVLTGDKLETAVNIGYSCNLLKDNMNLIVVKDDNALDVSRNVSQKRVMQLTLEHLQQALEKFFPDAPPIPVYVSTKDRVKQMWHLFVAMFRRKADKPAAKQPSLGSLGDTGLVSVGTSNAVEVVPPEPFAEDSESHELKERRSISRQKPPLADSSNPASSLPKIHVDIPSTSAPAATKFSATDSGKLPPIVETPTTSGFDLEYFREKKVEHIEKKRAPVDPRLQRHALVIDGACLKHAFETSQGRELLFQLASQCHAVLCCRVSPLQKAQVVELIKHRKRAMCLAIGDGANDVSMIQAAHIGVGIAGEEGLQAVMASDYAIAQFRFLAKLVLVQGRWAFKRNACLILNFFFKNLIWTMPFFYYQFFSGFTMTYVIDYTFQLLYQTVFSSTAIIVMGWFDRELDIYYLFGIPGTYNEGIKGSAFSLKLFWCYMLDALYQSLVIFFVSYGIFWGPSPFANGRQPDMIHWGALMAISGICNANFAVALDTNQWTVPQAVLTFVPPVLAFLWLIIYTSGLFVPNSADMTGLYTEVFASGSFWLGLILITTMCMLPRTFYKFGKRYLDPTDTEVVQEIQKYKIPIRGEVYGENMLVSQKPPSHRSSLASAQSEMTMTVMSTGETTTVRGFAFSQDAGTRDLLMGRPQKPHHHHSPKSGPGKKTRIWTPELQKLKLGVSRSMNIVKKVSYGGLHSLSKDDSADAASSSNAKQTNKNISSSSSKIHIPFIHHSSSSSSGPSDTSKVQSLPPAAPAPSLPPLPSVTLDEPQTESPTSMSSSLEGINTKEKQ